VGRYETDVEKWNTCQTNGGKGKDEQKKITMHEPLSTEKRKIHPTNPREKPEKTKSESIQAGRLLPSKKNRKRKAFSEES